MIKKTVIAVVAVGLVAGLLLGRDALSYLKTGYNQISSSVRDSVSPEFEINRARDMVADLDKVIKKAHNVIAKEEVALEQLEERIANAETDNQKLQGEIVRLQGDLTSGKSVFRYANRTYERSDVERNLENRFARYKVDEETLDSLKQMREARAANLNAAHEKYANMVSAKKKLTTEIKCLEAKQQLVEVAQATSDLPFDDSQLARTRKLIADIGTSLDVKARIANANIDVVTEIELDPTESGDITDQVAAYFNLGTPEVELTSIAMED